MLADALAACSSAHLLLAARTNSYLSLQSGNLEVNASRAEQVRVADDRLCCVVDTRHCKLQRLAYLGALHEFLCCIAVLDLHMQQRK